MAPKKPRTPKIKNKPKPKKVTNLSLESNSDDEDTPTTSKKTPIDKEIDEIAKYCEGYDPEGKKNSIQNILDGIYKRLEGYEEQTKAAAKINTLEKKVSELNKELSKKNKKIDDYEIRLLKLEEKNDNKKQVKRENELIMIGSGVKTDSPNLEESTAKFIKDVLEVPSAEHFKYKKIVGKSKSFIKIIVPSTKDKIALLQASRIKRPSNIFINESLTKQRQELLYNARKMKREAKNADNTNIFFSVFTFRGDIYIKKSKDGEKVLVKNIIDLQNLCKS
jgi:exosome complex exonuclease DIS3/RRP44